MPARGRPADFWDGEIVLLICPTCQVFGPNGRLRRPLATVHGIVFDIFGESRGEPATAPIGFNWQINVALIPGMAAREVAVAALDTVYAIEGGDEAAEQIGHVLAANWSLATALSLLAWYIFAPQCASTLAVIRRETGCWKWMAVTFAYMLALAYVASLLTYNIARAFGLG